MFVIINVLFNKCFTCKHSTNLAKNKIRKNSKITIHRLWICGYVDNTDVPI